MKNIVISIFVFVMSLAFAICLGYSFDYAVNFTHPFLTLTLLAFGVQWLAFIPAAILKTEKFYDLAGSLTYLLSIIMALAYFSVQTPRSVIISVLVSIWAIRLGSFLFWRIKKAGKDDRFDEIKQSRSRFFIAWNLQGLWVSLTSCAAWAGIVLAQNQPTIGWVGIIGILVWVLGFAFEVTADWQKSNFKFQSKNHGDFIQSGLWSLCRHPNYTGEITLWTGIFILSSEVLVASAWLTIISPVFVYFLLTKLSGVPLLTAKAQKKWGDDPQWREYYQQTPALLPKIIAKSTGTLNA